MKKVWKIVGIATLVMAIGVAALGVAYAQEPTPTPGTKSFFGCFGWGFGKLGDYGSQFLDTLASKLGIQRSTLDSAIEASRKEVIDQMVKDGKITEEQAQWMLNPTEAMKAQIEQMVKDGKITREQADWLLQGLEKGYVPMGRGFGFDHMRGGRFGGFRGFGWPKGTTPQATPTPSTSSFSTTL
ncbi:MAG: hypothetical protein Kow00123_18800 [Anaerolineales bacterium]